MTSTDISVANRKTNTRYVLPMCQDTLGYVRWNHVTIRQHLLEITRDYLLWNFTNLFRFLMFYVIINDFDFEFVIFFLYNRIELYYCLKIRLLISITLF